MRNHFLLTQLDLYSLLSGKLDIAISAGESEQTRWGFQKMLASKAVTIIQPDMAYCGGPSEALKKLDPLLPLMELILFLIAGELN